MKTEYYCLQSPKGQLVGIDNSSGGIPGFQNTYLELNFGIKFMIL